MLCSWSAPGGAQAKPGTEATIIIITAVKQVMEARELTDSSQPLWEGKRPLLTPEDT